ncbi:MAG: malonate transporter subunit MadL [Synergistaceae bacterium]|nr:malonate transporter subunit MadL [Synergistaceae bacterium]
MVIYGVLLLSLCYFAGLFVGEVTGRLVGLNANVGGVGFAMLFLLLLCSYSETVKNSLQNERFSDGLKFWQNMYIPVVIAMSASQDVVKAVRSGWLAILCGITLTVLSLCLIPFVSRISSSKNNLEEGARD